jgi:hypothetical protein
VARRRASGADRPVHPGEQVGGGLADPVEDVVHQGRLSRIRAPASTSAYASAAPRTATAVSARRAAARRASRSRVHSAAVQRV